MNYYRHVAFLTVKEYGLEIVEGASMGLSIEITDDSTGEVIDVVPGASINCREKRIYVEGHIENGWDTMRVLHEIGHYVCEHKPLLFRLLRPKEAVPVITQELEAWEFAFRLAGRFDLILYRDDVTKCLVALKSHFQFQAQGYSKQHAGDCAVEILRELTKNNPGVHWVDV